MNRIGKILNTNPIPMRLYLLPVFPEHAPYTFFLYFPCRRAASSVFTISIARVIGPTPPGTGVM